MRSLNVIFSQSSFSDFPCFILGPEEIKIQDFFPIHPVKPFDKGILRRFIRPDKLQHHPVFFRLLYQRQRHQFWAVIHSHLQWISAVCYYPVQYPDYTLGQDIQVDFSRQRFTVKIVHHIESPEVSVADQRVVHKIDGPALIKCLKARQWRRVSYLQTQLAFATKIQPQGAVNLVNTLMIPGVTLPAQHLIQFLKTVPRIAFRQFSQHKDNRFIRRLSG